MHHIKFLSSLFLITLLSSCATPYQQKGFLGGYTDSRLDSNTARVSFYGNGRTARETVENDMLYRCAEVTLKDGYDYFVIVTGDITPTYSSFTTPGTYNQYTNTSLTTNGSYGYTSSMTQGFYQPGKTIHIRKFESTVLIKMFNGKKPTALFNAYDAHEFIKYIKPVR